MKLKERIRELRLNNHLTAKEFGQIFNIAESTVSLYESGKRTPSKELIISISKYFNVSTDYLLGVTPEPHPVEQPKEFDEALDNLIKKLQSVEKLMFSGEPLDDETRRLILKRMIHTKELAENARNSKKQ